MDVERVWAGGFGYSRDAGRFVVTRPPEENLRRTRKRNHVHIAVVAYPRLPGATADNYPLDDFSSADVFDSG